MLWNFIFPRLPLLLATFFCLPGSGRSFSSPASGASPSPSSAPSNGKRPPERNLPLQTPILNNSCFTNENILFVFCRRDRYRHECFAASQQRTSDHLWNIDTEAQPKSLGKGTEAGDCRE